MHNRKRITAFLAALTVAALLTGCGGAANEKNTKGGDENREETAQNQETGDQQTQAEPQDGEADGIFSGMDTVDLEGNPVDASVFAENDLTMINIWATWCGPCVNEIPTLDELNKEYEGKGVAIKGLLYELEQGQESGVSDSAREAADTILTETGATYQQLTPSADMVKSKELSTLMAYPTTYFVDSKGNILGFRVGANSYDDWKDIIELYLAEATK